MMLVKILEFAVTGGTIRPRSARPLSLHETCGVLQFYGCAMRKQDETLLARSWLDPVQRLGDFNPQFPGALSGDLRMHRSCLCVRRQSVLFRRKVGHRVGLITSCLSYRAAVRHG